MLKLIFIIYIIIILSLIDFKPLIKLRKSYDRICIDINDNQEIIEKVTKCFKVQKDKNTETESDELNKSTIFGISHICSIISKKANFKILECNPYKDLKDIDNMNLEMNFLRKGLQVPSKYANHNIDLVDGKNFKHYTFVVSGDSHICSIFEIQQAPARTSAVSPPFKLKCWGDNSSGQISIPQDVKDIVKSISKDQLEFIYLYAFKNTTCFRKNNYINVDRYNSYSQNTYNEYRTVYEDLHSYDYFKCWGVLNKQEYGNFNIIEIGENETICLSKKTTNDKSSYILECNGNAKLVNIPNELKSENISVSIGYDHACTQVRTELQPKLGCWGDNTNGQANVPPSLSFYTASYVAANQYSCAAKLNAQVLCWGYLDTDPKLRFRTISLKASTYISAGDTHGCGIYDGELKCYGSNASKQLSIPPNHKFDSVQVTSGWYLNCSVNTRGKADCWGQNYVGQAQVPEMLQLARVQVISVHTAINRSCAIWTIDNANLKTVCWGGYDEFSENFIPDTPANEKIHDIAVGEYHTCIIYTNIKCFGENLYGQIDVPEFTWLEDNNRSRSDVYRPSSLLITYKLVKIAVGFEHTCITIYYIENSTQSIKCWGSNSHGQLTMPKIDKTGKLTHLKAFYFHNCIIHTNRSVSRLICWGDRYRQVITKIAKLQPRYVAVGNDFDCMIRADWQVYCWGDKEFDQCREPKWGDEFKNMLQRKNKPKGKETDKSTPKDSNSQSLQNDDAYFFI